MGEFEAAYCLPKFKYCLKGNIALTDCASQIHPFPDILLKYTQDLCLA